MSASRSLGRCALLRASKDEQQPLNAHPSRLAEDGSHLRGCDFFGEIYSRPLAQCDSLAIMDSREAMMVADELFGDLPEQLKPQAEAAPLGAPRLREPQRDQIALRAVDIENLIGEDHSVRLIWSYVEGLDLSELENRIKARGDRPGHPATSPRLLLALWLYATGEG